MSFNKKVFAKLVSTRFGVSQEDGNLFFEEVGQKITDALAEGETVFLFGNGTLKVVKKRTSGDASRIRFRPTKREARDPSAILRGLAGAADGVVCDAIVITSISAGDRALQAGRPCIYHGLGEQLLVYLDDDANHRCISTRADGTRAEEIMGTKRAAKEWLRANFAEIHEKKSPG